MTRTFFSFATTLVVLACWGSVAHAQSQPQQPPDPSFAVHLFAPELVMQHQRAIGLSREQQDRITGAVRELQHQVLDLQWTMQAEAQKLSDVLQTARVDSTSALRQVDRVLETERLIKRAHLGLLIQIKNLLTVDQQSQLKRLRDQDAPGRP